MANHNKNASVEILINKLKLSVRSICEGTEEMYIFERISKINTKISGHINFTWKPKLGKSCSHCKIAPVL